MQNASGDMDYANGIRQGEAVIAARERAEIQNGQVEHLREHHGHDHETDARSSERQRTDDEREHDRCPEPGAEGRQSRPTERQRDEAGAVYAGCEEHRVPEAQETGIPEEDVVPGREDGEHEDASERQELVVADDELESKHEEENGAVQERVSAG